MKYQGMLCVKIGDENVSVAPCKIDTDGGVFAVHESERNGGGKTVTWHRMGTIDPTRLEGVE